jgi:hypothetical protein
MPYLLYQTGLAIHFYFSSGFSAKIETGITNMPVGIISRKRAIVTDSFVV